MSKKELRVVLDAIRHAKDAIEEFGTENYPYTGFEDAEINKMYFELNAFCINISNRINSM